MKKQSIKFTSKSDAGQQPDECQALWRVPNGGVLVRYNQQGIFHLEWFASAEQARAAATNPVPTAEAQTLLDKLLAGQVQLVAQGTEFQRRVWQAVAAIPQGATASYGELARALGTRAARAVGSAVGANPLYVVIPCHRVLASDGSLGGYAYGLEHKHQLLESDKAHREWFLGAL